MVSCIYRTASVVLIQASINPFEPLWNGHSQILIFSKHWDHLEKRNQNHHQTPGQQWANHKLLFPSWLKQKLIHLQNPIFTQNCSETTIKTVCNVRVYHRIKCFFNPSTSHIMHKWIIIAFENQKKTKKIIQTSVQMNPNQSILHLSSLSSKPFWPLHTLKIPPLRNPPGDLRVKMSGGWGWSIKNAQFCF